MSNEIISVKDLSYIYSQKTPFEKHAVKNMSFTVNKGDYIAIIGHTGSGKSTLIQMLNGLIRPSSGTVYLDGKDVFSKETDIRQVRFKVGLCFQYPEYQLFEETVYADIAYGPKNKGLVGEELDRAVKKAAEFSGLTDEHLTRSPFELSGGEKRRAAIAGIMAMEPEVLILDEPTAGLDPKWQKSILAGIREYREKTGATVILVTHSMEDAAANADKLLVLNRGCIEFYDTPEKVFANSQRLSEIGLDLPQITKVFTMLNDRGFKLDRNVLTLEDAKNVLLTYLEKGGKNNV